MAFHILRNPPAKIPVADGMGEFRPVRNREGIPELGTQAPEGTATNGRVIKIGHFQESRVTGTGGGRREREGRSHGGI